MESAQLHVLKDLNLPDRYERLQDLLGPHVARLLVQPTDDLMTALRTAALSVNRRGEGLFLPAYGPSGAGKTTLASSLSVFLPRDYAPSVNHLGAVDYNSLAATAAQARADLPANDNRIIPITIDHREAAPPTSTELAAIKRFLRAPSPGARSLVVWPDTSVDTARDMSKRYVEIADEQAIPLPLMVQGPPRESWQSIAQNTMEMCNDIPSIDLLGVSPTSYDPEEFATLGKFMRRLSVDFDRRLADLIESTQMPVSVVIVFVSETASAGILDRLSNSTRYGLLDANALLAATPKSSIGTWWGARRGLLIQTILQLNAHAFSLGPAASIACLRQHGDDAVREDLHSLGISAPGPKLLRLTLSRADLGKFLTNQTERAGEDRGTPADTSTAAFQVLAEKGFTYGKDKSLNTAMMEAIESFLEQENLAPERSTAEKGLDFADIIPDNAFFNGSGVVCIEYTWRTGDYLTSTNKSEVAGYILTKLQNYARKLGWTAD